jgi:hypothetical protein
MSILTVQSPDSSSKVGVRGHDHEPILVRHIRHDATPVATVVQIEGSSISDFARQYHSIGTRQLANMVDSAAN